MAVALLRSSFFIVIGFVYDNKSLYTQSVTKQDFLQYQFEQNPTF